MLSLAQLGNAFGRLRKSLRTRMVAWFFVPTAIILVTVALYNFYAYQQLTEELVIERDQDVTRLAAGQLTTELDEFADLLFDMARTPEISQSDQTIQQAALRGAGGPLVVFDGGLVILNTFGAVVAAEPERTELTGQDWSDRDYFRQMVRTSRSAFSDVLADGPQQSSVVVIAVPITGGRGEFLGAMLGMFHLSETAVSAFYGELVKLHIAESGATYLVDGNSRVIYHSDADRIGADFSDQSVVQQALDGQVGAIRTQNFDGEDIVAGFAPVPGTSWGLITEESWTALTSGSRGFQRLLLLLLALGVAIPAIFVVIGLKRIMRPIEDLIGAAREVARGNFSQTMIPRSGGEIEELAREFNLMASQLQESYELLEQRVAERTKELRDSQGRMQAVVTSAPVVLFAMNMEGRITFAEGQGLSAFGFNPSDMVGESVFDADHNESEQLAENFNRAVGGEEFTQVSDLGELMLETRYSPLRDDNGAISGAIAVAFDVTERKQAEEALRQYAEDLSRSNSDLEQFAYVASHDLQEPLRAIVGFTKMLARRYEGQLDEDADDYISRIVNASGRMQSLIIDLLEYSRVGRGVEKLKPTDCETIVTRVIDGLHAAVEDSGAIVTHDPLPTVMADATLLGQVFSNLIANAMKFQSDGSPHVHVSARSLETEWVFSVQDDGIGLEPQYAERIFVIFQRLHARTEYEGTGIGLAICKKAVERLGGRIWVESQTGEGTTFFFTIPIAPDENGVTIESPKLAVDASPLNRGDNS